MTVPITEPIDLKWLKAYRDQLVEAAKQFPEGSDMRAAGLIRALHITDLVQAWADHVLRSRSPG